MTLSPTFLRVAKNVLPCNLEVLMADEGGGGKLAYFLAGLGIGSLIGILFAPHAGEETREMLTNRYDEGREEVTRRAREAREQAEDYLERGKRAVSRTKDNLQSAVDAGKQAYREASARGDAADYVAD
jgi:gas vesicle protein